MDAESAAERVKRFVETTSGYSLRGAGALVDVSQTHVGKWREWVEEGADPETLPPPRAETLQRIGDYLLVAHDLEVRRLAAKLAADRLEQVVQELREEARRPPGAAVGRDASSDLAKLGRSKLAPAKKRKRVPGET